jgi:hypothetical protein
MMPWQFLMYLGIVFVVFVVGHYLLKKQTGKGLSAFGQFFLIWITAYFFLKFVMFPPIPSALLYTYMGLISIVLFILISSTEQSWQEFKSPIIKTLLGETKAYRNIRAVSFAVLPILAGFGTYNFMAPKFEEPIELRTVHPAPPASIQLHGKNMVLQVERNPFRIDEKGEYSDEVQIEYQNANPFDPDAPEYMKAVKEGGAIFFQNCHFCHGDNLNGRGMFAFAFNPIPANFTDAGTIAQLQETFVLWRVSKGGPGLPREGFPWASAMPPWEEHLTTDELWKVIAFEYWHTGFYPRTWD